jgi:hypothetical protein
MCGPDATGPQWPCKGIYATVLKTQHDQRDPERCLNVVAGQTNGEAR